MSFNTIIDWNSCTAEQQRQLVLPIEKMME